MLSHHVRKSRFRNPGKFCLWNPESWGLESGKQPKESRILLTIGIQNPSSTDKYGNPVPGIRNPQRGFQNPRLPWIPLHGVNDNSICSKEILYSSYIEVKT